MSIHFSRSMRSINIDSYQASRIGLIVGSILVLALVVWFFAARVGLYAVSREMGFNQAGRLVATFSREDFTRIRPGQPANVRIATGQDRPPLVMQGTVFDTFSADNSAEILLMTEELPEGELPEGATGQVEVEVERITPLALVLRYSGKYLTTNQQPAVSQSGGPSGTD